MVAEIEAAGGTPWPTAAASPIRPDAGDGGQGAGRWGGVHILINNAGILRDKSFAKMAIEEFRAVVEVHLIGAAICTKAVWAMMQEQAYGRILMTTSSTGLYGNFGQSNYGAAKAGPGRLREDAGARRRAPQHQGQHDRPDRRRRG